MVSRAIRLIPSTLLAAAAVVLALREPELTCEWNWVHDGVSPNASSAACVATNESGDIAALGTVFNRGIPDPEGPVDPATTWRFRTLLVKLDARGSEIWRRLGDAPPEGNMQGNGVAIAPSGDVIVGCYESNPADPLKSSFWFIQAFSPDGTPGWSHRTLGPEGDGAIVSGVQSNAAGLTLAVGGYRCCDERWYVVCYDAWGRVMWERTSAGLADAPSGARAVSLTSEGHWFVAGYHGPDWLACVYDAEGNQLRREIVQDAAKGEGRPNSSGCAGDDLVIFDRQGKIGRIDTSGGVQRRKPPLPGSKQGGFLEGAVVPELGPVMVGVRWGKALPAWSKMRLAMFDPLGLTWRWTLRARHDSWPGGSDHAEGVTAAGGRGLLIAGTRGSKPEGGGMPRGDFAVSRYELPSFTSRWVAAAISILLGTAAVIAGFLFARD